jgi:hypothetical protein
MLCWWMLTGIRYVLFSAAGWVKLNAVQFLNDKYKQNKLRARGQGHRLMCKIKFEKKKSLLIIASLHEKIDLQLKLIYMW